MSTEDANSNNKRQTKIWFTAIAGALVLALAIVGVLFLTGTIVPNTQTQPAHTETETPAAGIESDTKTAEPTVDPETQKLVDAGKKLDKKKVILTGEDGCTVKGDMMFFGDVRDGEIRLAFGDLSAPDGGFLDMAMSGQTNMTAVLEPDGEVYPLTFEFGGCKATGTPTAPIEVIRDQNESDWE